MSADKYLSIFSRQMEAIVYLSVKNAWLPLIFFLDSDSPCLGAVVYSWKTEYSLLNKRQS